MSIGSSLQSDRVADPAVVNIAAYKFVQLDRLQRLRDELKQLSHRLGLRGTILLSPEGINLFLAGSRDSIDQFLERVRAYGQFADLEVKESLSADQPFNRMLVKIKREIIAFGIEGIDPARRTSPKLPPQQLKAWLDAGKPVRLLDTRNDYEVDLGTFQGAERLHIRHFREFPAAAAALPEQTRQEPVVMFCTGGIRCEKAGPMLEQLGFQEVYQLEGGILKYFEECGGAHYQGGCFVFDGRVVLNPDLKPTGAVQCFNCQAVLNHEDIQSPRFVFGQSCPHCYLTPDQRRETQRKNHESQLRLVAASQPGCQPYENRRRMHVPARLAGSSLLEFLCAYCPPVAPDQWLQWIEEGSITADGQSVSAAQSVREGQRFDQVQHDYTEPPVADDLRIVYEDEALVVIDKPAGLPVHASGRFQRNTLEWFLKQVYAPEKLRFAHRLDAATSGLVLLTRKYAFARVVQPQFSDGRVVKRYLLQVSGVPSQNQFQCEAAILDEPQSEGRRRLAGAGESGLAARTLFRVLKTTPDGARGPHAILEAQPITGRTHQIRLHAAHLGLPILGDPLYASQAARENEPLRLHAWQLELDHPQTGQRIQLTSELPAWCPTLGDCTIVSGNG